MIDTLVERIARSIDPPYVPVSVAIQEAVDALWRDRLASIDLAAARSQFLADGELLVLPELFSEAYVTRVLSEIATARARRVRIPLIHSAEHTGWRTLQRVSPHSAALYRSRVFLDWMSQLVDRRLQLKDEADDHACATYEYTRRGDHVAPHYDTCGCADGASYTQLLSLSDRSSQRLVVDLHTRDGGRVERREIRTPTGTLVVFCGSKVLHSVTPLGAGERRIILSMSYASDPSMKPWQRLFENVKDAVLYFGPSTLVRGFRSRWRA